MAVQTGCWVSNVVPAILRVEAPLALTETNRDRVRRSQPLDGC